MNVICESATEQGTRSRTTMTTYFKMAVRVLKYGVNGPGGWSKGKTKEGCKHT